MIVQEGDLPLSKSVNQGHQCCVPILLDTVVLLERSVRVLPLPVMLSPWHAAQLQPAGLSHLAPWAPHRNMEVSINCYSLATEFLDP